MIENTNFEYRLAQRNSRCRVCDKINYKDKDLVIYTYSSRNCGQNILICPMCIIEMADTIKEWENKK